MAVPPNSKPWYSCFLCCCCAEPTRVSPELTPVAAPNNTPPNLNPGAVDAKIAAKRQQIADANKYVPATTARTAALKTSRRHRKLDSTEVVSVHAMFNGDYRRSSAAEPGTPRPKDDAK